MLNIKIADVVVGIDNRYRHIEWLARDYVTDECREFVVSATDEDLEREAGMTEESYSPGYLESVVVYRKIAERLPFYDACVFHGAVLSVDGRGYAFTARSGVGKTTHTRLWLSHFGSRAYYVNGDKPIIRFRDGVPMVYGTPWMGKESYGTNTSCPLFGIAFLERGQENSAEPAMVDDVASLLVSQVYIPRGGAAAVRALSLCDRILSTVKLIRLRCNMDISAAGVAARAFGIAESGESPEQ